MFGNTGNIHRKKPTRAELKAKRKIEAQEHAITCEHLAEAIHTVKGTGDPSTAALTEAARLLRWFGYGENV